MKGASENVGNANSVCAWHTRCLHYSRFLFSSLSVISVFPVFAQEVFIEQLLLHWAKRRLQA